MLHAASVFLNRAPVGIKQSGGGDVRCACSCRVFHSWLDFCELFTDARNACSLIGSQVGVKLACGYFSGRVFRGYRLLTPEVHGALALNAQRDPQNDS